MFLEIDDQTPNIKKFECSICGKHVRHQKTLINHIRRVHKGMKPVCNQKCASQSHLNEHISSFHDINENDVTPKQTSKDESNAKSHDEHDVTDETMEKILPIFEMNKIQIQEPNSDLNNHIQALHDRDVKSDDDIHDVDDETIEKIPPTIFDENKIQDQKRSYDLIQMPEIDGELNQPLRKN